MRRQNNKSKPETVKAVTDEKAGTKNTGFLTGGRIMYRRKKQWEQQEYEEQIRYETEKLLSSVSEKDRAELQQKIEELTSRAEAAAFMEGYRYAVAILQDSMPDAG